MKHFFSLSHTQYHNTIKYPKTHHPQFYSLNSSLCILQLYSRGRSLTQKQRLVTVYFPRGDMIIWPIYDLLMIDHNPNIVISHLMVTDRVYLLNTESLIAGILSIIFCYLSSSSLLYSRSTLHFNTLQFKYPQLFVYFNFQVTRVLYNRNCCCCCLTQPYI